MEIGDAVSALGALAQQTRLQVFRLLVEAGPEGCQAGRIASRLGIAPATLSFHFKELERAGLIASRRTGRAIHYSANFEAMARLITFLTESCCGGRPEICALLPASLFVPERPFRRHEPKP